MKEVRCKECGRIIATTEGDTLTILCPHAGKRKKNGYIYGKCKTENKIKMNTERSVENVD